MMRIASFLLIAVLATTCVISGTFAKYTSDFSGSDSARVAKWAFSFGDSNSDTTGDEVMSAGSNFTFNLFSSINDYAGKSNAVDTDVDVNGKGDDATVIAPGTWGSVTIYLKNDSEVNATYTVVFTETWDSLPAGATRIPLVYSTNGTNWMTLADINDLFDGNDDSLTNPKDIAMNGNAQITLYWMWAFDTTDDAGSSDTTDTLLGWDGDATVTLTASVNVTQKN